MLKHSTVAELLQFANDLEQQEKQINPSQIKIGVNTPEAFRSMALELEAKLKALRVTIHVGKNELLKKAKLQTDDDYRLLLQQATETAPGKLDGKTSTKDLHTLAELEAVMSALRKKGFRVRHKKPTTSPPPSRERVREGGKQNGGGGLGRGGKSELSRPLAQEPQDTKIRALWLAMHQQGIVKDPSEQALAQWVKREFQVDALDWLTSEQCQLAIERLKKWQSRDWAKRKNTPKDAA